jgi:hypothetical protein
MKSILTVVLATAAVWGQSTYTGTSTSSGAATWPAGSGGSGGGGGGPVCGPPNYDCSVKSTDTGEPATHALPGLHALRLGVNASHYGGPYGLNMVDLDKGFSNTTTGGHWILRATDLSVTRNAGVWSEGGRRSISRNDDLIQFACHGGGIGLLSFSTTNKTVRQEWCSNANYNGQTAAWGSSSSDAHAFYAYTKTSPYQLKRWIVDTSAGAAGDPGRATSYTVSADSAFNGTGSFDPNAANCLNGSFGGNIRNGQMDYANDRYIVMGGGTLQDTDMFFVIWDATRGCRWFNSRTMQMSNGWNAGISSPLDASFDSHLSPLAQATVTQRSRSNNVATITYTAALTWYDGCTISGHSSPQSYINVEVNEDASFNTPRLPASGSGTAFSTANGAHCSAITQISYANSGPDVAATASTGKVIQGWDAHSVGIDVSGQFAQVGSAYEIVYNGGWNWDPAGNTFLGCTSGDPCLYHRQKGWGTWVYAGAYGSTVEFDQRQLSSPASHTKIFDSGITLTHPGYDDHISYNQADAGNDTPFLSSSWNANGTQPTQAYEGELVLVYPAGPNGGTSRRFAHAFGSNIGPDAATPQCQISNDGKYVICGSDDLWYTDVDSQAMSGRGWGDGNGNFTCDNTVGVDNNINGCRTDVLLYDLAGGSFIVAAPTWASVAKGATQQFYANTVFSNNSVTWSTNAPGASINSSGLFTAGQTAGSYSVTATSVADGTKSATAIIVIQ